MRIKTICFSSEEKFDQEVNQAISEGWKPDFSTYRTSGYSGYFVPAGTFSDGRILNPGCFNSIILTRDY